MGLFKKPKFTPQPVNRRLEDLQAQQLRASIAATRNVPQLKLPDPVGPAAPPQSTAQDQAAAERLARQQMAKKKGIAHSINPLGGAQQGL